MRPFVPDSAFREITTGYSLREIALVAVLSAFAKNSASCLTAHKMVKSYLKHGPTEVRQKTNSVYRRNLKRVIQAFGLVCGSSANSIWDGRCAFVPALEDVLVWDVKKGYLVSSLTDMSCF